MDGGNLRLVVLGEMRGLGSKPRTEEQQTVLPTRFADRIGRHSNSSSHSSDEKHFR